MATNLTFVNVNEFSSTLLPNEPRSVRIHTQNHLCMRPVLCCKKWKDSGPTEGPNLVSVGTRPSSKHKLPSTPRALISVTRVNGSHACAGHHGRQPTWDNQSVKNRKISPRLKRGWTRREANLSLLPSTPWILRFQWLQQILGHGKVKERWTREALVLDWHHCIPLPTPPFNFPRFINNPETRFLALGLTQFLPSCLFVVNYCWTSSFIVFTVLIHLLHSTLRVWEYLNFTSIRVIVLKIIPGEYLDRCWSQSSKILSNLEQLKILK